MSRAVINAGLLKDVLEAIRAVTDEAKFRLNDMGLGIGAVDPANVCLVALNLDPRAFEAYDFEKTEIGVDIARLEKMINSASREDKIELEVTDEAKKLHITAGCYSYTMSLLEVGSVRKEPKLPKVELPVQVVLNGALLRDIVKEAGKVSDHITIGTSGKEFVATATGDLDTFKATIPEPNLISIRAAPNTVSMYSLDYMSDLMKVLGKSERVTLNLAADMPVQMVTNIAGGNGSVTYFLAPRIESGE
jgi:proliferating cell nuclear antigen